jgi:hypothetical protein
MPGLLRRRQAPTVTIRGAVSHWDEGRARLRDCGILSVMLVGRCAVGVRGGLSLTASGLTLAPLAASVGADRFVELSPVAVKEVLA